MDRLAEGKGQGQAQGSKLKVQGTALGCLRLEKVQCSKLKIENSPFSFSGGFSERAHEVQDAQRGEQQRASN